jgi:predicted Zn-dependent protease
MQYEWRAYYLDGQTAIRHPATVRVMREGLEVETPGGWTRFWPYAELRQTQGFYEGEEVRLERGGELSEALLIPGDGFLASLGEAAAQFRARFHDPSRRGQRALDAIVARLAAAVPSSPYTFRLIVVNQPQVNALAAPGGYLVVYRGLLERTRSPEELAGVLAHEMQHVVQRHATQALIQHTSTGLLLAALTGDMTGPLAYGLQSARVLGQLQYSRRAEAQADAGGMKMLLAARIDPGGLIRFFDALAKADRQPAMLLKYLSTHPSPTDRIERLKALAATAAGPPVPLLPDTDWDDVKRLCESRQPAKPSS